MDAAYLQAAMPEPFTILGTKLHPFCLGHEIQFQRFRNRFSMEASEKPTEEDCLKGIFICSKPYRKDRSLDGYRIPVRARIATFLFGKKRLQEATILFGLYISAHCQIPDFFAKETNDPRATGTPTIQAVKVSLMANLGLSEDEALNTPVSLAFWNHLSWLEAQGSIQIIDDSERERIKQAKAFESKVEEMRKRRQNGS